MFYKGCLVSFELLIPIMETGEKILRLIQLIKKCWVKSYAAVFFIEGFLRAFNTLVNTESPRGSHNILCDPKEKENFSFSLSTKHLMAFGQGRRLENIGLDNPQGIF